MTRLDLIGYSEQIYPFGSRVYGTEREDSDHDFVAVLKKGIQKTDSILNFGDYHYQVYSHEEFVAKIEAHDIQALECIFLPKDMRLKFRSTLDYVAWDIWFSTIKDIHAFSEYRAHENFNQWNRFIIGFLMGRFNFDFPEEVSEFLYGNNFNCNGLNNYLQKEIK